VDVAVVEAEARTHMDAAKEGLRRIDAKMVVSCCEDPAAVMRHMDAYVAGAADCIGVENMEECH